jgi:hypothetical protein
MAALHFPARDYSLNACNCDVLLVNPLHATQAYQREKKSRTRDWRLSRKVEGGKLV